MFNELEFKNLSKLITRSSFLQSFPSSLVTTVRFSVYLGMCQREAPSVAPTHPRNIVIELKGSRTTRLVTGMSDLILVYMSLLSNFQVYFQLLQQV